MIKDKRGRSPNYVATWFPERISLKHQPTGISISIDLKEPANEEERRSLLRRMQSRLWKRVKAHHDWVSRGTVRKDLT